MGVVTPESTEDFIARMKAMQASSRAAAPVTIAAPAVPYMSTMSNYMEQPIAAPSFVAPVSMSQNAFDTTTTARPTKKKKKHNKKVKAPFVPTTIASVAPPPVVGFFESKKIVIIAAVIGLASAYFYFKKK